VSKFVWLEVKGIFLVRLKALYTGAGSGRGFIGASSEGKEVERADYIKTGENTLPSTEAEGWGKGKDL